MKGVSAIIATLLMLIITIAMAGLAYFYISGMFRGRTSVQLNVESDGTTCIGSQLIVDVRNDGSLAAGVVTIMARNSTGTPYTQTTLVLGASTSNSTNITRSDTNTGTLTIIASATGGTATGTVFCT